MLINPERKYCNQENWVEYFLITCAPDIMAAAE